MTSTNSNQSQVGNASATAFKILYGGLQNHTLGKIRHSAYIKMACRGLICPEKLPPTARAAHFHGLRVHHQIITWLSLSDQSHLNPIEWGWIKKESILYPKLTDIDIAPLEVKTVIRCNCNPDLPNPCSSRRCTCRAYGMACISLCGGCRGEECSNVEVSNLYFNCLIIF